MADKGKIRFSSGDNQYGLSSFEGSNVDRTTLDTFVTAIEPYFYDSTGDIGMRIIKSTFLDETEYSVAYPVNNGIDWSTDQRTLIVAKDSDGHVHKWGLPKFIDAHVEVVQGVGRRLKSASLTAAVALIATLTGLTLTPVEGKIIEKT